MYTTQFKLANVSAESSSIQINNNLVILSSDEAASAYGVPPKDFLYRNPSLNKRFGLHKFMDSLDSANTIVSCAVAEKDMESNPFSVDDCAYCAVALSIMKKEYFVAGIEKFTNPHGQISWGPWTTCFDGIRGGNPIRINASEEDQLRELYTFVFTGFTQATHSSKLLHLFCKCCCLSAADEFHVLKIGLPNFGNYATRILNAALLFEMVTGAFRAESIGESFERINSALNIAISKEDVKRVVNYRHLIVHENATGAKGIIGDWLMETGRTEEQGYAWAYTESLQIAKELIRAIALNYSAYLRIHT